MNDITLKMGQKLSSGEVKIYQFLDKKGEKTLSELSKKLKIDYKNVHRYVRNLYKKGIVSLYPKPEISKRGSPVIVSLWRNENQEDFIYYLLDVLNKNKGRMNYDQYLQSKDLRFDKKDLSEVSKFDADYYLRKKSGLVKIEISLTKKGKKFIRKMDLKKTIERLKNRKVLK